MILPKALPAAPESVPAVHLKSRNHDSSHLEHSTSNSTSNTVQSDHGNIA